jgi:hypothetical protein
MNTFEIFKEAFTTENNLDEVTSLRLITWLKNEGVLDFPVIESTYAEQAVGA